MDMSMNRMRGASRASMMVHAAARTAAWGRRLARAVMAAFAVAAMALAGLTLLPATANAATPDANLGVTLGDGATAYKTVALDQQDVRENALKTVVKWRRDAYNDPAIKLSWNGQKLTMPQYLAKLGMSKDEYFSPQWSNALERVAILRAIESSYTGGHQRMNSSSVFSASADNVYPSAEILAWGPGDIAPAIDLWASEKAEYIKEINGQPAGVTGHYTSLIDPSYVSYGFGVYNSTAAGEMNGDQSSNTDYTNLKGDYRVELGVGSNWDAAPKAVVSARVAKGFTGSARVFVGKDDSLEYRVSWSSSDSKVATVSDGVIKGIRYGKTTLTGTLTDGRTVRATVEVVPFVDVTSSTPHSEDILWLANKGIAKGYADGTFGGMRTVVRQDMAAFLYRMAGSPAFTPSAADKARFKDVNEGTPHAKEIWWLASTGIAKGYEDGSFGGMRTVVRQDMAAFLHRYAAYAKANPKLGAELSFVDVAPSAPHAADIVWLGRTGVAKGYQNGTFGGMRDVVRQDMAAFLHRMDTNVLNK